MSKEDLVFSASIDKGGLINDLKQIQREVEKATTVKQKAEAAKLPLERHLEELRPKLEQAQKDLADYQQRVKDAMRVIGDPNADVAEKEAARRALPEDQKLRDAQTKEVARLEAEWEKTTNKVAQYNEQIQQANNAIAEGNERAGEVRGQIAGFGSRVSNVTNSVAQGIGRIEKRLIGLAKRVFFFSMFTKLLRGAREQLSKMLSTSEEYNAQMAKLRGAFAVAFQPLFDSALPILLTILDVITKIVQAIGYFINELFGTTAEQSAKNAKALNDQAAATKNAGGAAAKASKQLAAFDEINKLNSSDSGGGGGGGAASKIDYEAMDAVKAKVAELTTYVSGALLALGAILTFTGANIPLGLGLMALGAYGLAKEIIPNWDSTNEDLRKSLARALTIVGMSLLALGVIMLVAGQVPLGLGLIVAGIGSMYAGYHFNPDVFVNIVLDMLNRVQKLFEDLMTWLDNVFAYDWTYLLGSQLGEVMNRFMNNVRIAIKGIIQIFNGLIDVIAGLMTGDMDRVAKGFGNIIVGMGNVCVGIINSIIGLVVDAINIILDCINLAGKIFGASWQLRVSAPQIPEIPMLAQGAVIPPNAPFLAMLGDQSRGNNIEAPEDLIRKIVREESGGMGNDRVVALLSELIDVVGGIQVGDEVIGRAATRYQRNRSRATGV